MNNKIEKFKRFEDRYESLKSSIEKRRGSITLNFLDALGHVAIDILGVTEALALKKLRTGMSLGPPTRKIDRKRHNDWGKAVEKIKENQKFYNLLSKLQKQGLVKKIKKSGKKSLWQITKKGLERVFLLKEKLNRPITIKEKFSVKKYSTIPSQFLKIVVFDIEEKEKEKRDWLRSVLVNLGFLKVQRSVWMGDSELPVDLIKDLKELDILPCVKIFSVYKEGSLF